jgi:hypothetical protein
VQTALLIVLEPIFEADLQPEKYAYRENRNALDAVQAVDQLLKAGYTFGRYYSGKTGRAYFCPRTSRKKIAYRAVNRYITERLRRWLCRKHGLRTRNTSQYSYQHRYHKLGLVHLPKLAATFRGRKHDKRS